MAKKRINLPYDRASDGPRVPVFVAARRHRLQRFMGL